MNPDQLALLHGYLSDTLDAATFAQLQSLLRESAEARRTLRSLATIDAHLHQLAAANPATALLLAHPPAHRAPTATWERDERDRKSTRLNSSHRRLSRMPSSA